MIHHVYIHTGVSDQINRSDEHVLKYFVGGLQRYANAFMGGAET